MTEGNGHAVAPDADAAMQHAFGLMFTWGAARRNERVVFGPRFALYTPVVQLAGGLPGLDVALAVREDASAIDALCRLALASYADWTRDAGAPIEAFVDGEPRAVSSTGAFDGSGREIRVRAACHETSAGRRCRSAIVGSRDSQAQSGGPVLGLTQRGVRGPEDEAA